MMRSRLGGLGILCASCIAAALLALLTLPVTAAQAASECSVTELAPVLYTAIDGHSETLTPWQGQQVAVLVEPGVERSAAVMTSMVCALDRAYTYYEDTVGRSPTPDKTLNGRDTIAEVTSTCGAGCTYLGATGTEILTTYFETLYNEIACCNLYDQVPFYELGRSFWFWGSQLAFQSPCHDPVTTGFAVWMRFRSMRAATVEGAPFNGTPFDTFESQIEGLEGLYDANTSDTFAGTLCQDRSPGLYGGTDFWTSIMMKLASLYGGQRFVSRFWQNASALPAASSTPGAITNWLDEASYAACVDLSAVFHQRWGFPQPDGSIVDPRPSADSVPFPKGGCGPALSNLTISSGTLSPAFSPSTASYSDSVSNSTSSVTVTPTGSEAHATIQVRVNGGPYNAVAPGSSSAALALNVGSNTIDVLVTGEDATTTTYTITVTRAAAADATLSNLTLSSRTLSPPFSSGTTSYSASVSNSTANLTVTPTATEPHATIQVRVNRGAYSSVASGSASGALSLNVGANTIDVLVTAQDGITTTKDTVTVTRAAECVVPDVRGRPLAAARVELKKADCKMGKISRVYSSKSKGRVLAESPKPGTRLPAGSPVRLTVSKGPKHQHRLHRR
jgi:Cadherin-like beta sandwich domain/PASTA domain